MTILLLHWLAWDGLAAVGSRPGRRASTVRLRDGQRGGCVAEGREKKKTGPQLAGQGRAAAGRPLRASHEQVNARTKIPYWITLYFRLTTGYLMKIEKTTKESLHISIKSQWIPFICFILTVTNANTADAIIIIPQPQQSSIQFSLNVCWSDIHIAVVLLFYWLILISLQYN